MQFSGLYIIKQFVEMQEQGVLILDANSDVGALVVEEFSLFF